MNPPPPGTGSPRPTVGHHFAALLQCPQKAWHDYHADPGLKAEPTAYLKALQREGFDHEEQVSSTLYPHAVKIPDRGDPLERAARTILAMRDGATAILQAFFHEGDSRGVADVLELVGTDARSRTGHLYRIGEFKRATALSTGHVMQVAWYNELLTQIQGVGLDEAFFILGDGQRTTIRLEDVRRGYEACKVELMSLRASAEGPGPHLCRWCSTCQWRGQCLPQLVEREHVSLLPGVSRRHAEALGRSGVRTWGKLAELTDETLAGLGFDGHEIGRIRDSRRRLERGEVVLRYSIKSEEFSKFRAVTLDYGTDVVRGVGGSLHLPRAIWYESDGRACEIPIVPDPELMAPAISSLIDARGLAFYGARDLIGFLKLVPRDVGKKAQCVDVLDLIERVVHAPLPGLELADVVRFAAPGSHEVGAGQGRIGDLRQVIDWLAGPLAVVA